LSVITASAIVLKYPFQIAAASAISLHCLAPAAVILHPHLLFLLSAVSVRTSGTLLTLNLSHLRHRPLRSLGPHLSLHLRPLGLHLPLNLRMLPLLLALHLRSTLMLALCLRWPLCVLLLSLSLWRTLRMLLLAMNLLRPLDLSLWWTAPSLMAASASATAFIVASTAASALTLGECRAGSEQNDQK
jgi:hypothetical protein